MDTPLIGNHSSVKKIQEFISLVSDLAFTVLLLGETGTGKEVVARLLHYASPRRNKRFIKVNCAALPLTLLESELFGYEKGAFTGADRTKPGKFELASDGVIFLDEIGDMPMLLQSKLLNVLQNGEFNRLGSTRDIKVNTWVISSTNHNLEEDIKKGLFREDLYYRLNVTRVEMPPLRERREDIPILSEYFIRKYRETYGIDNNFALNSEINKLFDTYHWPGNVRELSNTIRRLLVGDDQEKIRYEFLNNLEADNQPVPAALSPMTSRRPEDSPEDFKELYTSKPLTRLKSEAAEYIERKAIRHALHMAGGNKSKAAKILKVSYKAFFNKLDKLNIDREYSGTV
jgi:transcriptional regulator with PAS, ATPase and Fis domain